jgi:hypothetical protein
MAPVNGQKVFAAGRFFGVNNVTVPTPTAFGIPQDQSIDFKRSVKSLFGENQLAADVSSGQMEVTGKVSLGTLNARMFADLLFGVTGAAGQRNLANKEPGVIPATTPFTVTVANSATWLMDEGVINAVTGKPMTRVASGPITGQYSVAAGVYTFSTTDSGAAVFISYTYSVASTGETLTLVNMPMGKIGNFTAVMQFIWGAEQSLLSLNNCMSAGASLATKLDDYAKPSFDFQAACDTSDTLGSFSFSEAA